jgi:NADH-quinone oxidoreductase subunit L
MEGPTPASGLIHSATMVAAGVYLLIRFSFIINHNSNILTLVGLIGICSILIATLGALGEYDLKKIIAQSTVAQLGYMFLACGTINYLGAFYLLYTHSLCKASLFLLAGGIIHTVRDESDNRRFGALIGKLPVIYSIFIISSMGLVGFIFSSMHYSKELLLKGLVITSYNKGCSPIYPKEVEGTHGVSPTIIQTTMVTYSEYLNTVLYMSAIAGILYMLYLVFLIFFHKGAVTKIVSFKLAENSWNILIVLIIFSLMSYFIGYYHKFLFSAAIYMYNTSWNNEGQHYYEACGLEL